jgi:mannose-1-phosphate guanylyltransferase
MSTRERPKQLLRISGNTSLVRQTLLRIAPLAQVERTLVLTGATLRSALATELPELNGERIIGEPVGKNTAPAIALAAHLIAAENPDGVMVVLPADHLVNDADAFRSVVRTAVSAARETGALVTLGITPARPETEYGYIRAVEPTAAPGVLKADGFTEKPDPEAAERFLEEGGYYWNSGMFVWLASSFLREVGEHLPTVAQALATVPTEPDAQEFAGAIRQFYDVVPSISVDYAIMEKARDVLVVPAEFGWDDVGAWTAFERIWTVDAADNAVSGDVVAMDADDCVIYSEDGTVAVLGISGCIVARTRGATLVCPKARAREVRAIVERLNLRGAPDEE